MPRQVGSRRFDMPWRFASSMVMGTTAALCRMFLKVLNDVEVSGHEHLLSILDKRAEVDQRQRGLLTVSNHVCVLDDPLIWGTLPFRYGFNAHNHRWTLGAHDICFKNKLLGAFFSYGQVLPTYRYRHSPLGGPFQQSVADAIRLLSSNSPYLVSTPEPNQQADGASTTANYKAFMRPATAPSLSTIGSNWVHVFPEGCVHQDAQLRMRYFKWGVARLILEPEPAPDLLPIFIDGTQHIMAENRSWPRFLPRIGAKVKVAFGPPVDGSRFDDVRARWRDLVSRSRESRQRSKDGEGGEHDVDDLPDDLKYGEAASQIRIEVAKQVRDEVLRLRRSLGYLEEAAGRELARSWKESAEMIRPG